MKKFKMSEQEALDLIFSEETKVGCLTGRNYEQEEAEYDADFKKYMEGNE